MEQKRFTQLTDEQLIKVVGGRKRKKSGSNVVQEVIEGVGTNLLGDGLKWGVKNIWRFIR